MNGFKNAILVALLILVVGGFMVAVDRNHPAENDARFEKLLAEIQPPTVEDFLDSQRTGDIWRVVAVRRHHAGSLEFLVVSKKDRYGLDCPLMVANLSGRELVKGVEVRLSEVRFYRSSGDTGSKLLAVVK